MVVILVNLLSTFMFKAYLNQSSASQSTTNSNYKEAYKGSHTPDVLTDEQIKIYTDLLLPADDEYDYLYANDYQYNYLSKSYVVRDSKSYQEILGYSDVSLDQIKNAFDLYVKEIGIIP